MAEEGGGVPTRVAAPPGVADMMAAATPFLPRALRGPVLAAPPPAPAVAKEAMPGGGEGADAARPPRSAADATTETPGGLPASPVAETRARSSGARMTGVTLAAAVTGVCVCALGMSGCFLLNRMEHAAVLAR